MFDKPVDISIITLKTNESLLAAVKYCENRGSPVEIIKRVKDAKGLFICDLRNFDNTYFHDYFLHVQFCCLFLHNYDVLVYYNTVSLWNNKFYGYNSARTCFYKRGREMSKLVYHEENLVYYCRLKDTEPLSSDFEPEQTTDYINFFENNK
jgi:hypothetical protein